ncbi:MAG: hypothetical protein V3U46_07300 [Acidimicrobiia bacterium]
MKQVDQDRLGVESGLDLLVQELDTLPGDATVQLTEDAYPEVYRFFQGRIAAKDEGARSPSKVTGCCAGGSLRTVPTTGGVLEILDQGDGVIHVLAFAIDPKNPDLGNTDGLALSAIITEDGVAVVSMDMDRLSRFIGGNQSGTAEGNGGVAGVEEGGGDTNKASGVGLDCNWTNERVCCAVATESRFCVCCASLSPIGVGCACAQY